MRVFLFPALALTVNCQDKSFGQSINNRHPHPVQTARHLVGVVVELPAGVQNRHDHLGSRPTLFLMMVDWYPSAIVSHTHRSVGMDNDINVITVAR